MSDSPNSPSGFANVTRSVCGGLSDLGHRVSILGWQTTGIPITWNGCQLYPIGYNRFGADVLLFYLQRLRPDVLIILADVWWMTYMAHPLIANFISTAGIPWWLYYPIGGDCGDGRLPESWVQVLQRVDLPIAMSCYGLDVSAKNRVKANYIPHGVDTGLFRPPANKAEAKAALGYQDQFVVLSDARNHRRKLLPRTLEIFRRFATGKADVLLHLHCDLNDPAAQSRVYHYNLQADIDFLATDGRVRITPGMSIRSGIPIEDLARLYQAADVHLLASWGEGFGLPTLQAAAAGVVPVAVDYAANRELLLGHGEAVPARHFLPSHFGIRAALIDIDETVVRLEALYADRAALAQKSAAAVRFAAPYDWRNIIVQWDELLRRKVSQPLPGTSEGAPIRVGVAQSKAGQLPIDPDPHAVSTIFTDAKNYIAALKYYERDLMVQFQKDVARHGDPLTIPPTPPSADPKLAPHRTSGRVFIGGPDDVPVVQRLARIFPGLNVWAATPVELGPTGDVMPVAVWQPGTQEFHQQLATSVLAIDLGGHVPALASEAAELAVPCIGGPACSIEQAQLWPELSLRGADADAAAMLGRRMLTDHGEAGALCAAAQRQRLAVAAPPPPPPGLTHEIVQVDQPVPENAL
jgi:glycosyltransferase involved in cell wall biosynthesis